MRSLP